MKNRSHRFIFTLLCCLAVSTANLVAQEWKQVACQDHPQKRHENGMVEVNGKIYLLGGRGERRVDMYDPATNKWLPKAKPSLEMHHFQAVAYKHEIYILGGFTGGFPHEQPLTHIQIYDTKKDQWRQGPKIPQDRLRGAAGVQVYKDKIYVVCGIQDGHWDGHVAWLDEFDLKTGQWRKLADAPRPRDHFQVSVHEGKLYVAGGRRSSAKTKEFMNLTVDELDIYDFAKGTWTTAQRLPTPRAGTTTVMFKNKILVIGGESIKHEAAHNEVEAFNPKSGQWETWSPLLQGRHGMQAVTLGEKLYVAAGSANRGGGPELDTMEVLE